jgi:hypothetical protein
MLALCAVISTLQLSGPVPVEGGDYLLVPFTVPQGTVEFTLAHDDGSDSQILDWGIWSPDGFRGWGGGLTEPAIVGVAESSRGYLRGAIAPREWTLVVGKAKLQGRPGAYTVDLEFRDAATIPARPFAAWAPVTLDAGERWYAGDFHVHSEESGDAGATFDQILALARERGLDFVNISDHNTSSHVPRLAAAQDGVADVLLLRGAEITTYAGHGNAVGIDTYVDHRVGLGGVGAPTITAAVQAQGGVFIVNHPKLALGDLCIGCAWTHADTPWDQVDALEIQTGNAEVGGLFLQQSITMWDELEDAGHRLAIVGGSDDHRAGMDTGATAARIGSPTTMVFGTLAESSIVDGIRNGRTVVKLRGPDDPMVELVARDGGALEVTVTGGAGMVAELWRNGALLEGQTVEGDGTLTFVPPFTGAVDRFRVELTQNGQRVVITSHVYVEVAPTVDGGCCSGSATSGSLLLSLAVAAQIVARRRRRARA